MANSKQAEKRGRQTIKRTAHNTSIKTRVKSTRKALATAIETGDKETAGKKLAEVASAADSAASRIKSRSTLAVAKLG